MVQIHFSNQASYLEQVCVPSPGSRRVRGLVGAFAGLIESALGQLIFVATSVVGLVANDVYDSLLSRLFWMSLYAFGGCVLSAGWWKLQKAVNAGDTSYLSPLRQTVTGGLVVALPILYAVVH
jgi:hypothetical protein